MGALLGPADRKPDFRAPASPTVFLVSLGTTQPDGAPGGKVVGINA